MAGNQQLLLKNKDFKDPFNAGQMVGMLVMLTSIENNGGITQDVIDQIKHNCANNLEVYFEKPAEDIFLMIDNMVKDINKL
jgi:hypothetical protein